MNACSTPCSGHGYKFASVIGEIMADLGERGETRWDISLFRADRFGVSTSQMWRQRDQPVRFVAGPGQANVTHGGAMRAAGALQPDPRDTANPHYWQRNAVAPFW